MHLLLLTLNVHFLQHKGHQYLYSERMVLYSQWKLLKIKLCPSLYCIALMMFGLHIMQVYSAALHL